MPTVSADRIQSMVDAIASGNAKKVTLLMRAGVPADGVDADGESFLRLAARFARSEVFSLLVESGANLDEPELLEWAVDGDGGRAEVSPEIVGTILAAGSPGPDEVDAALRVACVSGNLDVIRRLIIHGANPNSHDESLSDFPLRNAVEQKNIAAVELLLESGADPNRFPVRVEDPQRENVFHVYSLFEFARVASTTGIASLIEALRRDA